MTARRMVQVNRTHDTAGFRVLLVAVCDTHPETEQAICQAGLDVLPVDTRPCDIVSCSVTCPDISPGASKLPLAPLLSSQRTMWHHMWDVVPVHVQRSSRAHEHRRSDPRLPGNAGVTAWKARGADLRNYLEGKDES
jgi:hypothetical protein